MSEQKTQKRLIKAPKVIYYVVTLSFMALAILALARLLFVNPANDRSLFGYQLYIVLSDSMTPEFKAGDLIITRQVDVSTLDVGDIITFRSIDPVSFNEVITHQIVDTTIIDNNVAFITQGVNNTSQDLFPVLPSAILGEVRFSVPWLGNFFSFLGSVYGYILFIFVPFVLLGSYEVRTFVKYLKERKVLEQAKHQAEKEALLAEIEALKQKKRPGRPKKVKT